MASRVAYRTCPLCEATCGLRLDVAHGRVTRIEGDREDPFSRGFICPKGSTLGALHEDPDRLRRPLVRRGGALVEATWDEAFAEVETRLTALLGAHGRNAVALYLGNPNAHNYGSTLALRPLTKALATRNVYSASTVDQMPKHVSCGLMFGHPLAIPVPDIDRTDLLLLLGANPRESNGSLATAPNWPARLDAIRRRGGRVIVVDPRRTRTAEKADVHVPIRPATDAALLAGMVHVLFAERLVSPGPHGLVRGADAVEQAVAGFTPERVGAFSGVPAETVTGLARELAAAPSAVVYGRIGTHTTAYGTLAAWLVDVLTIITGNLDRPGGAMFPHAAHEGPRRPAREFRIGRWRSRVRGLPETLGELPVSTLADEIETPGEGQVRALITVAGNPALTTPDALRLDRLLQGLDLVVCVDPYVNATTRHAHVVLPPPSALERSHYDLAFTALSVRDVADYSPAVFERAEGTPSEFEILVRLAAIAGGLGGADPATLARATVTERVGAAVADPSSPLHGREPEEILALLGNRPPEEQLLDLLLRSGHRGDAFGARPGGLTLDLLERHPHGIDFGPLEPRLPEALATGSGQVELAPSVLIGDLARLEAALDGPAGDGMVLVGRRQLRTANSWTQNVPVLVRGKGACVAQVHPQDAARLGLVDGGKATVTSAAGSLQVPVQVTDVVMPGVVSIPYGWGHGLPGSRQSVAAAHPGVNVNVLTDAAAVDPVSGNAVLNGIPVTLAPA